MIALALQMLAVSAISVAPALALVALGRLIPRWRLLLEDMAALISLLLLIYVLLFIGGTV